MSTNTHMQFISIALVKNLHEKIHFAMVQAKLQQPDNKSFVLSGLTDLSIKYPPPKKKLCRQKADSLNVNLIVTFICAAVGFLAS